MYRNDRKSFLAKTLRRLRVNAGFTQQNMADVLNINRSTYTYYETGKTQPDLDSLKLLSKVLSVEITAFLEDEDTDSNMLEDYEKRRPKKKVENDPERVGELSSKEKQLIALLRGDSSENLDKFIKELMTDDSVKNE